MLKNFSHTALGINGRQSELIELALTYGFAGMDIDMQDMLRRSQRTDTKDASKYLEAAKIKIGGFDVGIDLDADDLGVATSTADIKAQLVVSLKTSPLINIELVGTFIALVPLLVLQ